MLTLVIKHAYLGVVKLSSGMPSLGLRDSLQIIFLWVCMFSVYGLLGFQDLHSAGVGWEVEAGAELQLLFLLSLLFLEKSVKLYV